MEPKELLSSHFTFGELTTTQVDDLQGFNQKVAQSYVVPLRKLCAEILEPVRELLGASIRVNSGFRCSKLNERIKGSPTSQHMRGEAADLVPTNMTIHEAIEKIADWASKQPRPVFHQCLEEHGCIHVALPTGMNDGEVAFAELVDGHWTKRPIKVGNG